MESVENIIRKFKEVDAGACRSTEALLESLQLKQNIVLYSQSTYRNKNFLGIFFENVKKCIPRIEMHKVLGQTISNEQQLTQLRHTIKNDSLFSEAKFIVFFDTDKIKAKYLQTIFKDLSISSNLIALLFAENEIAKTAFQNLQHHVILEVPKLSGSKLEKWINNEAIKNVTEGCEPEALSYLAKEYGSEKIDEIATIITKAALITETDQKVSLKSILACSHVKFERDVFELFNAVSKKDKLNIATCINSVLSAGNHPLQIFSYFNKSIKTLIAQYNKDGGTEHAKDLHNQWVYNKLNPRAFDKKRLDAALTKLAKLEFSLKDNGIDHEVALKHTLTQI